MKYEIIDKHGDLAPMFREEHLELAKMFADMRNAKVRDMITGEIVADYCRCKKHKIIMKGEKQ